VWRIFNPEWRRYGFDALPLADESRVSLLRSMHRFYDELESRGLKWRG
jgi:hypothetical protein